MTDIATIESLARSEGVSYGVYVATNSETRPQQKTCPICGSVVLKKARKYCDYLCYLEGIRRRSHERYQKEKLTRTAIQSEQKEK